MKFPDSIGVELYAQCVIFANQRIVNALRVLNDAQEAANSEEKSSAGDKYETGRAMAHLEKEKAMHQLEEGRKLMATLNKISSIKPTNCVNLGSVVITNTGNFYMAISAGKISIAGSDFIALSPASPVGALLINKKIGDQFIFNEQPVVIQNIL